MILLNVSELEQILLYSLIGVLVVFFALVILVYAFKLLGYINRSSISIKKKKHTSVETKAIETDKPELTGYEVAAISMALHLFLSDVHDEESNIITIKRIERRYSPWNSKIYGLTNLIR